MGNVQGSTPSPMILDRAMDLFRSELHPIVVEVPSLKDISDVVKAMGGNYIPLSVIDYVQPKEGTERLRKAYEILSSRADRQEVVDYWSEPCWRTRQISSFGERLASMNGGPIKVVFWIENTKAERDRVGKLKENLKLAA